MIKLLKNIIFYILLIIFYFYLFVFTSLYGIIYIISTSLYTIIYLIIPILILLLPLIIKYLYKRNIHIFKFIILEILIHFTLIVCIHYGIILYMKQFNIDKWSNPNWIQLRHLMIDDFKNKYKPIGKDKDEITKILGNYDYINEECICYDVRLYKDIVYDTYCLYYNKDNIITNTAKTWEGEYIEMKKIKERPKNCNVSYIRDVLEVNKNNMKAQYLIFGKLKTLFGEPNYLSINNEDWFGYFIMYKGKYFEIYGASDIAHIGGDDSKESIELAKELSEYILSTNSSDYEWTSYYIDFNLKITYKVENGIPSRKIEELTLSDEEFSRLYNKVYNLN